MLDYVANEANLNYRFTIGGLRGGGVSGVILSNTPLGGGNTFSSAKDVIQDAPIVGKLLKIKDSFSNVLAISGRSSLTQAETTLVWNGSSKPQFTVDFIFYEATANEKDSAIAKIKRLQSAVLPTLGGGTKASSASSTGKKEFFFKAPLGYNLKGDGTLTLDLGKWFRATNLVVINTSFVLSREVMRDGRPLYVTGTVTLEPYKAITWGDFVDYFKVG